MRVSQQQIQSFIRAIDHYINGNEKVELRLFGSRTDDTLIGGDIDLLLIAHSEQQRERLSLHKAEIFAKIYMQIEEEKIDLTVCNIHSKELDPFITKVVNQSIMLHRWG